MLWSLALLFMCGLAMASPIETRIRGTDNLNVDVVRNSVLEEQLLGLLEGLRETMLTGSDDIPVLDPLEIDAFTADENLLPVPGLYVALKDTKVNKLSTFVIDDLTVQRTTLLPLRYRLTLNLHVPVLEVDSDHYELEVPVEGLLIFGSGDAKINIVEPRVTVSAIIRPSIGFAAIYLRIEECEVKFSLRSFQPQINGLLGGNAGVTDFINTFLQYLVEELIKLYEDDITQALSSLVLDVGNDLLSDLNLIDLLG